MEGESCVTRTIIEELHSWDMKADETEGESGDTRNIIDELNFCDL